MDHLSNRELLSAYELAKENETRYKILVDNSVHGITLAQGNPPRFLFVNPPMEKIIGYSPEEMLAFNPVQISGLIHQDDRERFFTAFNNATDGTIKRGSRQYRMIHKNGEIKWVDVFPSLFEIDGMIAVQGTFVDITRWKVAEIKLSESERMNRELFERAPDAIFHGNHSGDFISVNKISCKLTGYSKKELLTMNMKDLFSEETIQSTPLRFDLLREGKTITRERTLKKRDGGIAEVEMSSLMLPDGTFLSFVRDISVRKRADRALAESEERYKMAFKTSPDSININRMDGTYVDVNKGFTRITGYSKKEIIGRSSMDLNIWANKEDRLRLVEGLNKNKVVENLEAIFIAKDGSLLNGLMSARIITLNNEPHILSITRDITAWKSLEADIIRAKDKAEESDRLKTEFINNMSHEIRTPLNAIIGFANMMEDGSLSDEQRAKYSKIIESSGNQLLSIISDIMDISKLDSNQLNLRYEDHNLNTIMDTIFQTFKASFKEGLVLKSVNGLKDSEAAIKTDRNRLIQIISNLLSNAHKNSDSGEVEFGYDIKTDGFISFYVRDTGIGIPREYQTVIFERFRQLDNNRSVSITGTGLGLSIVKALVQLFNGDISLESEPGKGSIFSFRIPYIKGEDNRPANLKKPVKSRRSYTDIKILIAEDDEYSFLYLEKVLERAGCAIIRARDGIEALDMVKKSEPDLILMDLKMPGMNGLEVVRKIRANGNNVFIIAQTAYAMKDDRNRAISAGCNEYISKPVDLDELFSIIEKASDLIHD